MAAKNLSQKKKYFGFLFFIYNYSKEKEHFRAIFVGPP